MLLLLRYFGASRAMMSPIVVIAAIVVMEGYHTMLIAIWRHAICYIANVSA